MPRFRHVPVGTYNCNYRGTVAVAYDFAMLDPSRYRDYDGNTGTYRFSIATGSTTGSYCPFSGHNSYAKHL